MAKQLKDDFDFTDFDFNEDEFFECPEWSDAEVEYVALELRKAWGEKIIIH